MLIIYVALWWAFGIAGYVFWWTRDYDLTLAGLLIAALVLAWIGPLTWLVGYTVHGRNHDIIIMRKRGK